MKWHTAVIIAGVLLAAEWLGGCGNGRELDEQALVIAMGLDGDETGEGLLITYQFVLPQPEGGKEGQKVAIITNKASALAESRMMLTSEISLKPSMAHLKMIVIGEKLARRGIGQLLASVERYREYRGAVLLAVTQGKAQDFLQENKPIFTESVAKYYENLGVAGLESGYYLPATLHQFSTHRKSGSCASYMMLAAAVDEKDNMALYQRIKPQQNKPYIAGSLPRQGGNKGEFAGTAVFKEDKLAGMLDTGETRMLSMLLGSYQRGVFTLPDPQEAGSYIDVNLRLREQPRITVMCRGEQPVVDVNVSLEGEINSVTSDINFEQHENMVLLEEAISETLTKEMGRFFSHTQELGTDVAGMGYYLRSGFSTNQEYKEYHWPEKYSGARIEVAVKAKIRRSGLIFNSTH